MRDSPAYPSLCQVNTLLSDWQAGSAAQQGFDCAYDKLLYDRLRERCARPVRDLDFLSLGRLRSLSRYGIATRAGSRCSYHPG